MRKISYMYLQKKYSGQIVALDKEEKEVVAYAKKFSELFNKLEKKHLQELSMSIHFPYEKKYIEEGEFVNPRVTLEVKAIRGFLRVKFLLDSGADVSSLPINPYAELFRFRRNPKERVTIGGVEGRGVAGYPFKLQCRLNSYKFSLRSYFLESRIDPLLGRLDFWNFFSIHFENEKLQTILTSIK